MSAFDAAGASDRRETFRARGYLAIERIASDDEVAAIRAICERLFYTRAGFVEGQRFNMVGADDGTGPQIAQILNPRDFAPELAQTRFHAAALQLAREILGPEARLTFDHAIRKPPLDGAATPWHQDESFRDPAFDYDDVSVWMPLQPVDMTNGCMGFIPGAGLDEVLPHRSAGGDSGAHAFECVSGFEAAEATYCPLPAGGCTVHGGRTVHGAGANHSPEPRYAYTLVFEAPKRRRAAARSFPWQTGKVTPRMERERAWGRTPAGVTTRAMRKAREIAARILSR